MYDIYYCDLESWDRHCPMENKCRRYAERKHIPEWIEYGKARLYNICAKNEFSMYIPITKEEEKVIEHGGIYVVLGNKKTAESFVNLCSQYSGNIDVYQKEAVLDGKSNVGILSLSLAEEICVEYIGEVEDAEKFYGELQALVEKEQGDRDDEKN